VDVPEGSLPRPFRYPHLAAALAVAGPARPEDDIYESTIQRLIDIALPG
jgi:hypothetical protein